MTLIIFLLVSFNWFLKKLIYQKLSLRNALKKIVTFFKNKVGRGHTSETFEF